ncbi:DUF4347 domain-containing protein [Thauera sp. CAU 1555]|uniref:DUF4347 domain-containing protein n=1 Tax=Thauera sedimentorum TaxID=2767595 RepID=A0ABR9B8J9_9RHOO|nr:DUF4347 domain-containing protein [Thauera sedimentorum]MBC9071577.1 DUF4347 domain-containing protein [Thauera sedimentorum]MBD8502496.1 DUF4347 domain-containing protein [Thauera sedimentorum]
MTQTAASPVLLRPADATLRDGRMEVVFIDAALPDLQTLIDGIPAGIEVRLIDASQDGFVQMAMWADAHRGYDAIHVLSHGADARKHLGSVVLTGDNLSDYTPLLERIGQSVGEGGDILLYGCNVAQGELGRAFVEDIARLTRADVAASDDATGAVSHGGDWSLEVAVGDIDAEEMALPGFDSLLSALSAGDIAVIGINGDDAFPAQRWAFVAMADISAGTVIHFTDASFDATLSGNRFYDNSSNEGHMTWTVESDITAGQAFVVTNNGSGDASIAEMGGAARSGVSGSLGGSSVGFHSTGDQIFVYQGTAGTTVGATFIYGLNNGQSPTNYTDGSWMITSIAISGQNLSYKPGGLVDGTSAAVLTSSSTTGSTSGGGSYGFDNMRYIGITTGTREQLLAAIGNAANWSGDNTTPYELSSIGNFTLTAPNATPTITGATAGQTVDDTATVSPFSSVTITDTDADDVTVTVALDALAKGAFTAASLSASGFTANGNGTYSLASGSAAAATTAIRQLVFDPADNRVAPGGTETTTFTITVNDGTENGTDTTTTVVSTSVNDAPTDIGLSATSINQSSGTNATIGTLSTTDVDTGQTHSYSLVSGTGDTDNALFNISGATLRANDTSTMAPGTYSVRVQTDDGAGGTYQETFSITVVDNVAPGFDESTPATANLTATTLDLTASLNEAGTLYYVVVADGAAAPNAAQVRAGQDAGGSAAMKSGSAAVASGAFTHTFNFTGLTAETAYDIYVVGEDDEGSPNLMGAPVKVDVTTPQAGPVVTDAHISITSSPSGTASTYKIGDTITAQWDNSASGQNQSGVTAVIMDFSAFGGGGAVVATNSGSGIWTASYTLTAGNIDAGNLNVSVSATDSNGTTTAVDTANLTADNQAPAVSDPQISISGASGIGGAYKTGDTVTVSWNNTAAGDNNADIASVTADFSAFGGGSAVAASNSGGTWTATYTIAAGNIDATGRNVSLTVTDDAGNVTTTAASSNATVDSQAPTVSDGHLSISGATGVGGVYKIGDTVTVSWDDTAGGDSNSDTISGVTVDFSQFGGAAAVAATNSGGTWTATYTIVPGAIDGVTNRNVSVTVTDNAGNTATVSDTANATVDSVAPGAPSGLDLAAASDSGNSDTDNVTNVITPTITGVGAVVNGTVTLSSSLGGVLGTTTADAGGNWSFTPGTALTSGTHNVTATTSDAAGNVSANSAGLSFTIDTAAPTTTVTIDSISTDSAAPGDFITNDADGLTVVATLSAPLAVGESLEYSADGTNWTDISSSVIGTGVNHTDSSLTSTATVTMRVRDSAGNSGTAASQLIIIDSSAPVLDAINSSPADDASGVAVSGPLTLKFDEALDSGSDLTKVHLKDVSTDTLVPATVSLNASGELVITPSTNLSYSTAYYVTWDADALKDAAGNAATAVGDETTFNFSTTAAPPAPPPPPGPVTVIPPQSEWEQLPDNDGDGVPEAVEAFVPGLIPQGGTLPVVGDGNGDGVADAQQPDVASVPFRETDVVSLNPDAQPAWVTLAAANPEGGNAVPAPSIVNLTQLDAPADRPAVMDMPLGLIAFEAQLERPGEAARFSLYVDADLGVNGYWQQDASGMWVNLASAPYGGGMVEEGGRLRLDFTLEDGGRFDADGLADGVITAPGAVAYLPGSIIDQAPDLPSDGFWL